ncbi:MAG TPA: hypothetical protein VFQ53_29360 [Kofleriaceae bacterium]|nr:hypothetical protein [Kofleriaceae bacterium]
MNGKHGKHGKLATMVLGVVVLSQVGATDCGGNVIRDPGFDLWCGDSLCTWKLLRGDVERVGTWHEGDSGISLVGADTAIQQISPVNSHDGNCIRFALVANVDESAEVFLDVDVEGDGTVEQHERIPTSHWKPLTFHIYVKPPYDGIRFELNKRGTGSAVLAQIQAELSDQCEGLTQLDANPRPNGASCELGTDCASGICLDSAGFPPPGSVFGKVCVGCDPAATTTTCGTGQVCGVGSALSPILAVPVECVPAGSRELAQACLSNDECETGFCSSTNGTVGLCSGCGSATDCGGEACSTSWVFTTNTLFGIPLDGPNVCQPGARLGAPGAACGTDADCASNSCSGSVRKVCNDGRECSTPGDCPVTDGLAPGPCNTVGIQGGTCD